MRSQAALARHTVRGSVRDESEVVRIWLLGDFRVSVGTRRTIRENGWRRKKAASLVKLLALEPGHRMHQEQILERLWLELDLRTATIDFHQVLHIAHRMLDPGHKTSSSGYLRRRGELLKLCPNTLLWVYVEVFEEAAVAARRASEPRVYRAALKQTLVVRPKTGKSQDGRLVVAIRDADHAR